jgi:hypothetical protein
MGIVGPKRHVDWTPFIHHAGTVAAIVLASVVNVLAARHFVRWDWTTSARWTLAPATIETLRALKERVDLWIVVGPSEPLRHSLEPIVDAYRAQSNEIAIHWIDPDRDAAKLTDLERRFGLDTDRATEGKDVADAAIIVAKGDRHWFVTSSDLVEATDDGRIKPREERALTRALRHVLDESRAKICFTAGHGELALEGGRDEREGLAALHDLLEKSDYDVISVDASPPDAHEPFAGCTVVVVAGERTRFGSDEENRLRTYLLEGGSLLAAVGPVDGPDEAQGWSSGLDGALAPFGVALDDSLIQEVDPRVTIPETHGEGFFVSVRPHPVTEGLADLAAHPPRVAVFYARSLRHIAIPGSAVAADLLVTSDDAFGKRNITGARTWDDAPPRAPEDIPGPLVVAMAAERRRTSPTALHGPRVVVIGSRFALADDNWRQPRPMHGAAFFVDSAISWLAASPFVVDVPEKAELMAGVRISEENRREVRRYVLVFMPLAVLLLAASVWAWRRSGEGTPYNSREPRTRP